MMGGVWPETCWVIKKQWNNKFYYSVASCWFFLWDLHYDARIHEYQVTNLDGWLTVHRSITLIVFQLDAQNSYLFIYNIFIKILYMFRALPCSSSGLRRNFIHAASGTVTFCRWLSCAPVFS
jgi:hypothetical protein